MAFMALLPPSPSPKFSQGSFWLFSAIPIGLGLLYLSIAYPRFCDDPTFILEHLLVLALWVFNTALLTALFQKLFSRAGIKFAFRLAALIPAAGSFLLYVIYMGAVIGNFAWNAPATFNLVIRSLPDLFQTADTFLFSRAWIVVLLAVPPLLLVAFYQWQADPFALWAEKAGNSIRARLQRRQFAWVSLGAAAWLVSTLVVFTATPSLSRFGNFHHDPVVAFFVGEKLLYPMTNERRRCVKEDEAAKKATLRRTPQAHNVFLFVVDALRADHLPVYGYGRPITPFLSGFFPSVPHRQVDMALSNGLETSNGVLSMLTSKEPMDISPSDYTLPDFLSLQGFKVSYILSGDHHWYNINQLYGSRADVFIDGTLRPGPHGINDDQLVLDEIGKLKPDDGGYHFFYIHLMSVHQFGYLQEKYFRYKPIRNYKSPKFYAERPQSREEIGELINMYDDRILQMDDFMKQVLSLFRQKGYLKDYLAVFTADHGQLLGDHGKYGHGTFPFLGGIHIPMVFFGSKPLPSFPETHFCVQIDIAPTLADLAGLGIPAVWQGQSLLRPRTKPWSYHFSVYHRPGIEGAVVRLFPRPNP